MITLYKVYPWVALVVVLVIGFTVPAVGIILLIVSALTLIFFNVKVSLEPRWGKQKVETPQKPAPPPTAGGKRANKYLKRMKKKLKEGDKADGKG